MKITNPKILFINPKTVYILIRMLFHNIGTPVFSKQIQLNSSLVFESRAYFFGKSFHGVFPGLPAYLVMITDDPDFQFHNFRFPNWSVYAPAWKNSAEFLEAYFPIGF